MNGQYQLKANNQNFQFSDYTLLATTTDGTATTMTMDGSTPSVSNTVTVPVGSTFHCQARVVARSNTAGEHAGFMRYFIIQNTISAGMVGTEQVLGTDLGSNGGLPPTGWNIDVSANLGLGAIEFTVTGVSATTIDWFAKVESIEVS